MESVSGARALWETAWHHLPKDRLPDAVFMGGALLLAGVVMAFWGSKLLRPIFALTFVGSGAWFGGEVGKEFGISETIGIVIGAAVLGVLGYVLYRVWVAATSGLLVAGLALCVFGIRVAGPHWSEYVAPAEVKEFRVGQTDNPERQGWDALVLSVQDFRAYLRQKEADVDKNAMMVLCVAGLAGFFLGLFAERIVTTVWTSALGVLVASVGILALCLHARPAWQGYLWDHPHWVLAGLACLWALALGVQWRGMRRLAALASKRGS